MKTYFSKFLLLLSILILVASCKKDDDSAPMADEQALNLLGLGESAEDVLSDDIYKSLVVEIVYSNGFRPEQETIDNFRQFLNARLNKPEGIQIIETVIAPPAGEPYNIQEIRDIEAANRTRYTMDDQIAIYIFFANGNAASDTNSTVTLGSAYRNTSIVVYRR